MNKLLNVWMPWRKDSGVLKLRQGNDWNRIHASWGKREPVPGLAGSVVQGERTDFLYLGGELVCSDIVWQELTDAVGTEVYPLPLDVDGVLYQVLNVVNVIDCLKGSSQFIYGLTTENIVDVAVYDFDIHKIGAANMFRIPQVMPRIFVTDKIKNMVEIKRFTGISFRSPYSSLREIGRLAPEI